MSTSQLSQVRRVEIIDRASYVINLGDIPGMAVTDALTGRVTVGGVVIGEPLCAGCDEPVADGPCACQRFGEAA